MRTETIKIYQFSELGAEAKDRAREWLRECESADCYWWIWKEAHESRKAFLDSFGAELKSGRYQSESVHVSQDLDNMEFVRLWKWIKANFPVDLSGGCPFTGVCYDEDLLGGIREFLRKPYRGITLSDLLYSCCEDLRISVEKEIEYRYSDEAIDETLIANEYEFLANGERYF